MPSSFSLGAETVAEENESGHMTMRARDGRHAGCEDEHRDGREHADWAELIGRGGGVECRGGR